MSHHNSTVFLFTPIPPINPLYNLNKQRFFCSLLTGRLPSNLDRLGQLSQFHGKIPMALMMGKSKASVTTLDWHATGAVGGSEKSQMYPNVVSICRMFPSPVECRTKINLRHLCWERQKAATSRKKSRMTRNASDRLIVEVIFPAGTRPSCYRHPFLLIIHRQQRTKTDLKANH